MLALGDTHTVILHTVQNVQLYQVFYSQSAIIKWFRWDPFFRSWSREQAWCHSVIHLIPFFIFAWITKWKGRIFGLKLHVVDNVIIKIDSAKVSKEQDVFLTSLMSVFRVANHNINLLVICNSSKLSFCIATFGLYIIIPCLRNLIRQLHSVPSYLQTDTGDHLHIP